MVAQYKYHKNSELDSKIIRTDTAVFTYTGHQITGDDGANYMNWCLNDRQSLKW